MPYSFLKSLMKCDVFGKLHARPIDHHAVQLTETVEVRCVQAAVITLQRRQDIARTDTGLLTLGRIDIDHVLRERRVERRACSRDLGTLVQLRKELLGDAEKFIQVTAGLVLQVQLETVGSAVSRNHRRGKDRSG